MSSHDKYWRIERYPEGDEGFSYGCPSLGLMGYMKVAKLLERMTGEILDIQIEDLRKDNLELRYCKECLEMTNHRVTKLPLQILVECSKCENLRDAFEEEEQKLADDLDKEVSGLTKDFRNGDDDAKEENGVKQ